MTQSTQGALSKHSESTKLVREKSYFVIPSEPKILCLFIQYLHIMNTNGIMSLVCARIYRIYLSQEFVIFFC